jgi:hypothetical protein
VTSPRQPRPPPRPAPALRRSTQWRSLSAHLNSHSQWQPRGVAYWQREKIPILCVPRAHRSRYPAALEALVRKRIASQGPICDDAPTSMGRRRDEHSRD